MNKKILSLVLIMMLLIGGLVTLTGCGNKNLTADVILEQRSYKVTLTTPATEKTGDDGKKAVVPNYAEESTTKLSTTDCGIIGDKVAIEFSILHMYIIVIQIIKKNMEIKNLILRIILSI